MEKLENITDYIFNLLLEYGPKLIMAIVTLIIGLWIISAITKGFARLMEKRNLDPSLRPFLRSLFNVTIKVLLIISVMSMVGIAMTSFIAILGAAGLAIGMALSGMLQNFAGGVVILIFKPFKVGDYIEAQGHQGAVCEIQIFNTLLRTPDNKTIIIPNGGLSTNSMVNFTTQATRRVDFSFGIGYQDDIDQAKAVISNTISSFSNILKTPEPFIAVGKLNDSSVDITVRVWTKTEDYWDVHFQLNEEIKKAFDKQGISIPFPQTDVHIYQNN